jgi:hypothetical protein
MRCGHCKEEERKHEPVEGMILLPCLNVATRYKCALCQADDSKCRYFTPQEKSDVSLNVQLDSHSIRTLIDRRSLCSRSRHSPRARLQVSLQPLPKDPLPALSTCSRPRLRKNAECVKLLPWSRASVGTLAMSSRKKTSARSSRRSKS